MEKKNDYQEIADEFKPDPKQILEETLASVDNIIHYYTKLVNLNYEMSQLSEEDMKNNKETVEKIYLKMIEMSKIQHMAYKQ